MSSAGTKISALFLVIIVVTLALATVAIFQGVEAYSNGNTGAGHSFMVIGISGFVLSAYMMIQTRRRTIRINIKTQPVTTTVECQKCGFKNIRKFQRGDFIFKKTEECPKCKEEMQISSIFREADEKEKLS